MIIYWLRFFVATSESAMITTTLTIYTIQKRITAAWPVFKYASAILQSIPTQILLGNLAQFRVSTTLLKCQGHKLFSFSLEDWPRCPHGLSSDPAAPLLVLSHIIAKQRRF